MSGRFERTGEYRPARAGDWFERGDSTHAPLLCINADDAGKRWILRRVESEPEPNLGRCSGWVCGKVRHDPARTGYLHGEDDDEPYDVDGCSYCGRCHGALRKHETHKLPPELKPEPERKAEAIETIADLEGEVIGALRGCVWTKATYEELLDPIFDRFRPCDRAAVIEECARRLEATNEPGKVQCQLYASSAAAIVRSLKGAK